MQTLHPGEDNLLEWDKMTRADTGAYVNNATVSFALKDSTGAAVTNGTGALSYVAASNGKYQGVLPATAAIVAGQFYTLELTAASGADDGFRRIRCVAAHHAE